LKNILGLLLLSLLLSSMIAPSIITAYSSRQPHKEKVVPEIVKEVFSDDLKFNVVHGSSNGLRVLGFIKPSEEYRSVLVVVKDKYLDLLKANVFKIKYSIRLPKNDIVLSYVVVSKEQLTNLLSLQGVEKIIPSPSIDKIFGVGGERKKLLAYEDQGFEKRTRSPNGYSGYGTFKSLDVMGVKKAWETYGMYGEGVVVGVVDTGIDFGSPELGLDAMARDEYGLPMTIVCDEHLAFTPINVVVNASGYLNTSGAIIPVYSTIYSAIYGIPVYYVVQVDVDYKMNTNITSSSGVYKFGILEWGFIDWVTGYYITILVPVVLINTTYHYGYDTAIFDLSTAFYQLSTEMRDLENSTLGTIYWRAPDPSWEDYSFEDEPVVTLGINEIIARDFDSDGFYDFSLGSISGYYLDTWGLTDYTWNETTMTLTPGSPGQRIGLDPYGKYIVVFTDIYGHGTSVATVIAARGNVDYIGYGGETYKLYGVAPKVKLAGGTGFLFGDLMMVEYWIAGWDWYYNPYYGFVPVPGYFVDEEYMELIHRADIVSNSWSYINVVKYLHQFPGYDILSAYFNHITLGKWLGTLLYTEYWYSDNVTLVFAAGNEGPGYGSVNSPGADLWIVTVGASTLFEYYQLFDYPPGYADDIIPFSSRGPSGVGYPKPDVVAIGAFEWAGIRTIEGRGYGVVGYWEGVGPGLTLFGGTSEATPFVSGILALGVQAFKAKYGRLPSPLELKTLLKCSADDLNYPALSQGSGRANAYKLLKTILEDDFIAYIYNGITNAFVDAYGNFYSYMLGFDPSGLGYMFDAGNYAVVAPSSSSQFDLYIKGYGYASIDAVTYVTRRQLVLFRGLYDFSVKTFTIPHWLLRGIDYIEIYVVFMNLTYPYPYYDMLPNDTSYLIRVDAFDCYMGNLYRLNTEARSSTTALLTIGNVGSRIKGDILVRLRPNPYSFPLKPVKALVVARLYKAVRFSWIRFSQGLVRVNGLTTVTGTIRVPRYAKPGVYEYKIRIKTPSKTIIIPGTILVPLVFSEGKLYSFLYTYKSRLSYDSYTPIGLVDPLYGDLTESLDWRMIPVLIYDPTVVGLVMYARWRSGYATSLEVVVAKPGGVIDYGGYTNKFATYKLTGTNGYVYNPNPYDQLRGRLKLFIPAFWPLPLRSTDIQYHYTASPGYDYIRSTSYENSPYYFGLYRVFITYGSYSGKMLFDTVRLAFFPIRGAIGVNTIDSDVYQVNVEFYAPIYVYQLLYANLYVFTDVDANISNSIKLNLTIGYRQYGNGSFSNVLVTEAYKLINVYRMRYRILYIVGASFVVNGTSNIDVSLLLPDIYWHTSGIYYYDYDNSRVAVSGLYYSALPTTVLTGAPR